MAYTKGDSPMRRRGGRRRRKVCAFCTEADAVIDYKDNYNVPNNNCSITHKFKPPIHSLFIFIL